MAEALKFNSRRSVVVCKHGCVASSSPLASQAGLDILKAGGNAADAAVAVAAVLSLVEPNSTGLGGDAFCMFYNSSTKTVEGLNGSGRCPQALSLERLKADGFTKSNPRPLEHVHCVTVPGAASCWVDTVEKFGSGQLHLSEILKPAIEMAEEGYPVQQIVSMGWAKSVKVLQNPKNLHGKDLLLNGEAPKHGDVMHNPHLASVLKDLAHHGKSGFYSGRVAEAVIDVVQQHGGVMTAQDLVCHSSTVVKPISTVYKGCRLWELPPNGQGLTALIALNILEGFDLKSMDHNSAPYLHLVIESLRLAFADSLQYCSDPDQTSDIPLDRLISKEYASERRKLIQPDRVIPSCELVPPELEVPRGADTVYFSTADEHGNACSFTNSNFMGFGSGLVPQGCGFSLQNRGAFFSLDPNHRNVLAPGKRPYHTIIPAMVTAEATNDLLMSYGVMGGYMQPQGHVQVLLNMLEFGMNPQTALDVPRISLRQNVESFVKPGLLLDAVDLEEGMPDDVVKQLKTLGHDVEVISGFARMAFGRGQTIALGSNWWQNNGKSDSDQADKLYWAGSDPRGDGLVAGY